MNTQTVRRLAGGPDGGAVAAAFRRWTEDQRRAGVRLILVEGLGGSGKTCLVSSIPLPLIKLDEFLPKDANPGIAWKQHVIDGGAREKIRAMCKANELVLVEGIAAWPVVEPIVAEIGHSVVRRVYLKRLKHVGGSLVWKDGYDLEQDAQNHPNLYSRSSYEHHWRDRPWKRADWIIERIE